MAILYDILKAKQLNKYPPLPQWIRDTIKILGKDENGDDYFDFTHSIRFDPLTKKWTRVTND
jgi:hypothetical protein